MPTRTTAQRTTRTSSTHPTKRFRRAPPHSHAHGRAKGVAALAGISAITAVVARRKRAHRLGDEVPQP